MKKFLCVFILSLSACAIQSPPVDNTKIFSLYKKPFKILFVGGFGKQYVILSLIDADGHYFNIRTLNDKRFVRGEVLPELDK